MRKYLLYVFFSLLFLRCSPSCDGELIFVKPGVNDRFQYPYFLFVPDHVSQTEKVYVIVEPNNSGFADDDFQKHIEKAKRTATRDFYLGNYLAKKFSYPLMVPVFPRPATIITSLLRSIKENVYEDYLPKCRKLFFSIHFGQQ